jgi:glucarate dehydratase
VLIDDVTLHRVLVPLEAPTIWIGGVDAAWTRTILRMRTDDGIEGLSETSGDDATFSQLLALKPLFLGRSPFDRQRILSQLWEVPVQAGASGKHAVQAFETACWDLVSKALGQPLHGLLGGKLRSSVPMIGYVHPRVDSADGRVREGTPAEVLEYSRNLVESYGFRTLKLKGGVFSPREELETVRAMREEFPTHELRFDPNALWSVETAIRIGRELEGLSLEWYEDPTWGIEGMGRVRSQVGVPLATNMCCLQLDQLAPAIRAGAFDVELLDIDDWGGLATTLKAAATCEVFGVGVGLHSTGETGIGTALRLQVAATIPAFPHAMDSYYHHQTMDVIKEPLAYEDGSMAVPSSPGIGVEVDDEKLRHLEDLYRAGNKAIDDPTPGPRYPGRF